MKSLKSRGLGNAVGRGRQRNTPRRRGNFGGQGRNQLGTEVCTCPDCNYTEPHKRGVPCREAKCPKCGTLMQGELCVA
ncbi:MAG TPA: hypothetical protein ENN64_01475 [bacterium]|nr:hypothetical protein [bacterium]